MTIRAVLLVLTIALPAAACGQEPATEAGGAAGVADAREADETAGTDGLTYGRYICRDYGSTSATFRNRFDLVEGGRYVYHGSNDVEGTYAYDAATGRIDFTSGPYAAEPGDETTIHGVFAPTDDGTPQITLVFGNPSFPNQGTTRETCRIRTDAP